MAGRGWANSNLDDKQAKQIEDFLLSEQILENSNLYGFSLNLLDSLICKNPNALDPNSTLKLLSTVIANLPPEHSPLANYGACSNMSYAGSLTNIHFNIVQLGGEFFSEEIISVSSEYLFGENSCFLNSSLARGRLFTKLPEWWVKTPEKIENILNRLVDPTTSPSICRVEWELFNTLFRRDRTDSGFQKLLSGLPTFCAFLKKIVGKLPGQLLPIEDPEDGPWGDGNQLSRNAIMSMTRWRIHSKGNIPWSDWIDCLNKDLLESISWQLVQCYKEANESLREVLSQRIATIFMGWRCTSEKLTDRIVRDAFIFGILSDGSLGPIIEKFKTELEHLSESSKVILGNIVAENPQQAKHFPREILKVLKSASSSQESVSRHTKKKLGIVVDTISASIEKPTESEQGQLGELVEYFPLHKGEF